MKAKIFLSILALLVFSTVSVSAEVSIQEFTESSNIGNIVGPLLDSEDISVQGAKVTKEQSSFESNTRIDITKEDGSLKIKDSEFTNIQPAKEGQEAYFEVSESGELKSCDFYTNEKGGKYTIGNYDLQVPPNSRVTYKDGNVNIVPTENIELTEDRIPKFSGENKPYFSKEIATDNLVSYSTSNGARINLPNGNILQEGNLEFYGDEAYISGNKIKMNDLEIIAAREDKQNIRFLFDGEMHSEIETNYISTNPSSRKMYAGNKDAFVGINEIKFNQGNPFVKVDQGDFFSIGLENTEFGITNPEGRIPEMTVNNVEELDVPEIKNGKYEFNGISKNKISVQTDKLSQEYSTTPIEITFNNPSTLNNKALVINSDDSYSIIRQNTALIDKQTILSFQEAPITERHRLFIDSIKQSYPSIELVGVEHLSSGTMQTFEDTINSLPERLTTSTKSIKFVKEDIDIPGLDVLGVTELDGSIVLESFDDQIIKGSSTIPHELAHSLGKELNRDIAITAQDAELELKNRINQQLTKRNIPIIPEDVDYGKMYAHIAQYNRGDISIAEDIIKDIGVDYQYLNDIAANGGLSNLDLEWTDIQGKEYYHGNKQEFYPGTIKVKVEGKADIDGFVREYGHTNLEEDKATFVEQVYEDPSFFNSRINPQSPQYDERYVKKLELLKKYEFISQEKFNEIFRAAGLSD